MASALSFKWKDWEMDLKSLRDLELRSSLLYIAFPSLICRDLGPAQKELLGVIGSALLVLLVTGCVFSALSLLAGSGELMWSFSMPKLGYLLLVSFSLAISHRLSIAINHRSRSILVQLLAPIPVLLVLYGIVFARW